MGSTHPPLESLMTFSHNCLEGFEHSRLNRISILRKEFHEIFEELVQFEIDARLARWILEGRQASGIDSLANHTPPAEFVQPEFALRRLARGPGRLGTPGDGLLGSEFPFDSMLELSDGVTLEVRLPFRRVPVSQDASAALRSLEHFARCTAGSFGDHSIDLLIFREPGLLPHCPFQPFPELDALRSSRTVSSPISHAPSSTSGPGHCTLRLASTVPKNARALPLARHGLHLIPRLRRRLGTSVGRWSVVVGSSRSHLPRLPSVRPSLQQSSLRRTAILLRD
jgi:hypothetical protein